MTVQLLQLPRPLAVDANGQPRSGAKLYVYKAQASIPAPVYQDAALTILHASPIRANTDGLFPPIYPDPSIGDLKINITTFDDLQVADYPIDNIPTQISSAAIAFHSSDIAGALDSLKQTDAERLANVTPVNLAYAPGHVYRYGTNTTPGTTDMTAAIRTAFSIPNVKAVLPGDTLYINSNLGVPLCGAVEGCGFSATIIKCGPAVTKAISLTSSTVDVVLSGFRISGNATAGALGIVMGDGSLSSNIKVDSLWIDSFTGAGAAGVKLDQVVTVEFQNTVLTFNYQNFITGTTPGLPTNVHYLRGSILHAVMEGVAIQSGSNICFHGPVIEANGKEGITAITAPNCRIEDLLVEGNDWFETNWFGHTNTGTKVFDIRVDGSAGVSVPNGTNIIMRDVRLSHGTDAGNDMRSVSITHAFASFENLRCYFGFPYEIVIATSDCYVQLLGDSADRMSRFISNPNGATVLAPIYKQVFDNGDGTSVLPTKDVVVGVPYSASMTFDAYAGDQFYILVTDTNPFTINAPTKAKAGRPITVMIQNNSGSNSLGTATWNAVFKMASWTQPANNLCHSISFLYDGVNWRERNRTTTAIPL